jgi:uncharacterized protein YjbI with pentapeptide repeats
MSSFLRFVERVTPGAFLIALAGLLFQIIGTEFQAQGTSWQLVTSRTPGSGGKVEALKYLNRENRISVPVGSTIGEALTWIGLNVEDGEWLIEAAPVFKKRADLAGIDLSGESAPECKRNAEQRVILQGVQLERGRLRGAKFRCVDFKGPFNQWTESFGRPSYALRASFEHALLEEADFSGATLDFATFTNAKLSGAKFDDTTLLGTDFSGVDGDDVFFRRVTFGDSAEFRGAKLRRAHFEILPNGGRRVEMNFTNRAKLLSVVFKAYSIEADFTGADLSGSNLSRVRWGRSNFSGAILTGVNFAGADLSEVRNLDASALATAHCIDEFTRLPKRVARSKLRRCDGVATGIQAAAIDGRDDVSCGDGPDGSLLSSFSGRPRFVHDDLVICVGLIGGGNVAVFDVEVRNVASEFEEQAEVVCVATGGVPDSWAEYCGGLPKERLGFMREKVQAILKKQTVNCVIPGSDTSGLTRARLKTSMPTQPVDAWCSVAAADGGSEKLVADSLRESLPAFVNAAERADRSR